MPFIGVALPAEQNSFAGGRESDFICANPQTPSMPLAHSPLCLILTFATSALQALGYVFPSIPQTGSYSVVHTSLLLEPSLEASQSIKEAAVVIILFCPFHATATNMPFP